MQVSFVAVRYPDHDGAKDCCRILCARIDIHLHCVVVVAAYSM